MIAMLGPFQMYNRARDRRNLGKHYAPLGTTLLETVIACALLSAVAVSVSVLNARMKRAFQDRTQVQKVWNEVRNARQIVGSWQSTAVTRQRIESLPISKELSRLWPDIRWESQVEEIRSPVLGKRVFIGLRWSQGEQRTVPLGMTFWVPATENQEDAV